MVEAQCRSGQKGQGSTFPAILEKLSPAEALLVQWCLLRISLPENASIRDSFDCLRRGWVGCGVEEKRPLRRQNEDHHFWSLIMLAVTAAAFLLVVWVATKALFVFLQESPIP